MPIVRKIIEKTKWDTEPSKNIRQMVGSQEQITSFTEKKQLSWCGHFDRKKRQHTTVQGHLNE